MREVLGMWGGGNESAKYWLGVLNEIMNCGVEDIMIVSVDGLTGFGDAIYAVFRLAEIQRSLFTRSAIVQNLSPTGIKNIYDGSETDI